MHIDRDSTAPAGRTAPRVRPGDVVVRDDVSTAALVAVGLVLAIAAFVMWSLL